MRRLLGLGLKVIGVARAQQAPPELLDAERASEGQLTWRSADLAGVAGLEPVFASVRTVFHVAALVDSTASWAVAERANVIATRAVCELALKSEVAKLVYIGTSDVFGLPHRGETITEQSPYRRWGEVYPDSKIAATEVVRQFAASGLIATIVHPGWVYGPGDRAFLPAIIQHVRSGFFPDWSPRRAEIQLVYIEDLLDGLCAAAARAEADNEEFLILEARSGVRLMDLCDRVARRFGISYTRVPTPYVLMSAIALASKLAVSIKLIEKPWLSSTDVKSFGYSFRFSTTKAERLLGWKAQTLFEEGISASLSWQIAHNPPRLKSFSGKSSPTL